MLSGTRCDQWMYFLDHGIMLLALFGLGRILKQRFVVRMWRGKSSTLWAKVSPKFVATIWKMHEPETQQTKEFELQNVDRNLQYHIPIRKIEINQVHSYGAFSPCVWLLKVIKRKGSMEKRLHLFQPTTDLPLPSYPFVHPWAHKVSKVLLSVFIWLWLSGPRSNDASSGNWLISIRH